VAQGTGKWFGAGKGYGFIAPAGGTPGVFLRKSAIEADGYRNLQDSPRVAYTVTRGSKGPRAEHG
jgi:cold shock protein